MALVLNKCKALLIYALLFAIILYMKQVTISSKNQITLPSAMLRAQKLRAGQKLYISEQDGIITLDARTPLEQYIEKATVLREATPMPTKMIDPLKLRQDLRDEWEDR